jgi:acetyl esterase/lipase
MLRLDRREFIAIGASAALFAPTLVAAAAEPPAPPAIPVPPEWEQAPVLPLWPERAPGGASFNPGAVPANWPASYRRAVARPELRVFRPRQPNGRAVMLVPGGAYWFVSFVNEGIDVARALNERGVTAFVLTYRLPGEGWSSRADVPLQDAQRAIRVIRARAADYAVNPARVAVVGFSAGGHLAATLATAHAERVYTPIDAIDREDARPQAAGLIYPVVTMRDPYTHALSRQLLLGDRPSRQEIERRSAELHVDPATPPLFLVHALDDTAVPVENSVRLLDAMRAAKRPVEAHLLQEGGHAFGIGRPGTPSAQWVPLLDAWWARLP